MDFDAFALKDTRHRPEGKGGNQPPPLFKPGDTAEHPDYGICSVDWVSRCGKLASVLTLEGKPESVKARRLILRDAPPRGPFRFSAVSSAEDAKRPKLNEITWGRFAWVCEEPEVRAAKDGLAFLPAVFGKRPNGKGNLRVDANVELITAVVFDLDGKGEGYTCEGLGRLLRQRLGRARYVAWTTYSSTPEAPRWRVVLPLAVPIPRCRLPEAIAYTARLTGLSRDTCCDNPSRLHYLPAVPPGRGPHFHYLRGKGRPLVLPPDPRRWGTSRMKAGAETRDRAGAKGKQGGKPSNPVSKVNTHDDGTVTWFTPHPPVDPGTPIPLDDVINKWQQDRTVSCRLWAHQGVAEPANELLGGKAESSRFTSPLPWRCDRDPSAYLLCGEGGKVTLYDHGDEHGKAYGPEEYAMALAYKKPLPAGRCLPKEKGEKKEKNIEPIVWSLRLLVESGVLKPAPVEDLPPCPEGAPPTVRKTYDGFRLLLQCKGRVKEWAGEPTAFAKRFAAAWCGVSELKANDARLHLARLGIIHICGTHNGRTCVYRPGPHCKHENHAVRKSRPERKEERQRRAKLAELALAHARKVARKAGWEEDPATMTTSRLWKLQGSFRGNRQVSSMDRFLFINWLLERNRRDASDLPRRALPSRRLRREKALSACLRCP